MKNKHKLSFQGDNATVASATPRICSYVPIRSVVDVLSAKAFIVVSNGQDSPTLQNPNPGAYMGDAQFLYHILCSGASRMSL